MSKLCEILTKSAALCLAGAVLLAARGAGAGLVRLGGSEISGSVNVTIKGIILTPPPCTINNNVPIDVDFGNAVDISKVDGKNYLKDIRYTLECSGASSNRMKLSIAGTAASFDDGAALDAGHGGLGIELQHNGEKLALGRAVTFAWPELPALQAVPVKKAGATLETGEFSVGATMIVDWE